MKIELGKKYVTRSGEIVTLKKRDCDDSPWVFISNVGHVYTETGHIFLYAETMNDIVREYISTEEAARNTMEINRAEIARIDASIAIHRHVTDDLEPIMNKHKISIARLEAAKQTIINNITELTK